VNGFIPNTNSTVDIGTGYILREAETLGITWREIPGTEILELNYNGIIRHFRRRMPFQTKDVAFYACLDKAVTRFLLQDKHISVPNGVRIYQQDTQEEQQNIFNKLQKPLVVKPTHASHGDGISMGVETLEQFNIAVKKAFEARNFPDAGVSVEETFVGKEYRVLATKDRVVAVMHRIPANVIGDGVMTLGQLIEEKNKDPRRETFDGALFRQIEIDDDVKQNMAEQSLTLDSVPAKDEQIFLRKVSNLSQGGDGIDLTDDIHPSVAEIVVKSIAAIPGLELGGIDFMTKDIYAQQTPESYSIIEINSSPELAIHDNPIVGKKRFACQTFLEIMFPEMKK
jgi:D-alanine-D-alanine ligase-like ATP-grasp enzyme